jgi:hypothetical protein
MTFLGCALAVMPLLGVETVEWIPLIFALCVLLMSPDCVFDASLVSETCPNGFVDSRELNKQVSEECAS